MIVPATAIRDDAWDAFVAAHSGGWVFHRRDWIRFSSTREVVTDLSFGLVSDDGYLVGICPLVSERDHWLFGGEPGPVPLISTAEAVSVMSDHLIRLEAERQPKGLAFRYQPLPLNAPPPADRQTCRLGDLTWLTQVIDLGESLDVILHGFRKSNRSGRTDVRKLADQYPVVSGAAHLRDFMDVHREAWHGRTWSPARWAIIERWLADGTARIIGVPGQAWVLSYAYKCWSYYAAGPSLDHHLGLPALCQWAMIQALKAAGVPYYELGWYWRSWESDKHRTIAAWKQSFGGEPWRVYVSS
jgi:hypothetical protein